MAKGCPIPALKEAPGDGGTKGSSGPHPWKQETGSSGPLPQRGPRVPTRRKQETGYSGPLPERGPRVPSQQGLSHGYPTQGVTRESPTAICPGPTPTQGSEAPGVQQVKGEEGGGGGTPSVFARPTGWGVGVRTSRPASRAPAGAEGTRPNAPPGNDPLPSLPGPNAGSHCAGFM